MTSPSLLGVQMRGMSLNGTCSSTPPLNCKAVSAVSLSALCVCEVCTKTGQSGHTELVNLGAQVEGLGCESDDSARVARVQILTLPFRRDVT